MKNLETRFNRLEQQQGIQPPPAVVWQPDSTLPNVYNTPSSVPTGNGARGNNGERPGTLGLQQWRNGYEGESPRQLSRRDGPYCCFQCGQPSHFKRNCPYQDDYKYSAAQSFQPSRQGTNSGNLRSQRLHNVRLMLSSTRPEGSARKRITRRCISRSRYMVSRSIVYSTVEVRFL